MKNQAKHLLIALACLSTHSLQLSNASAQTNLWTAGSDGKWEDGTEWSLAVPPADTQSCYVANAGTKTVTIDATTSGSFPATMTVTNLTVNSVGGVNTLALTDAGMNNPLRILNALTLSGGNLLITNSALEVDGLNQGNDEGPFICDGTIVLNQGVVIATNQAYQIIGNQQPGAFNATGSQINLLAFNGIMTVGGNANGALNLVNSTSVVQNVSLGDPGVSGSLLIDGGSYTSIFGIAIGNGGTGLMTVLNGTVNAGGIDVGFHSPGTGTLTVLGGSLNLGQVWIGEYAGSTGLLVISNGTLNVPSPSSTFAVGDMGDGTLDIAGGTVQASFMPVGQNPGSSGSVIVRGGALNLAGGFYGALTIAGGASTTGAVSVVSGSLDNGNAPIIVGLGGQGSFNVSGGNVFAEKGFNLGVGAGSSGALTISGGTVVSDGDITGGVTNSSVTVTTNGTLIVTNAAGDGTIALGSGSTLTLKGGILAADMLDFTNGGNFVNSGGTLLYTGSFQLQSNSTVTVNNGGSINAATNFIIGSTSNSSPAVVINNGGSLTVTNGDITIGNDGGTNQSGGGSLTVSNGTVVARAIAAGSQSTNLNIVYIQGTNGLIQIGGFDAGSVSNSFTAIVITNRGRMNVSSNMSLGSGSGSTAGVGVSDGGMLTVSNTIGLGNNGTETNGSGSALMTISNATVNAGGLLLGSSEGGMGSVGVQSNGLMVLQTQLDVGAGANSTGTMDITGGMVDATAVPVVQIGLDGGCGTVSVGPGGELDASQIHAGVNVGSTGALLLSGGVIAIHNGSFVEGLTFNSCGATGLVQVTSGALMAPSNTMTLGTANVANMTVSGGTVQLGALIAGGGAGSIGTINQSGGSITVNGDVSLAPSNATTTATATITGGTFTATNGVLSVGSVGTGVMTVASGGTVSTAQIKLGGSTPGASGTLHLMAGGVLSVHSPNPIANALGLAFNDCEQDGGEINAPGDGMVIGDGHNALYHISGGTAVAASMAVGYSPGYAGTFTQDGGIVTILTNLTVGNCSGGALGVPVMNHGTLYVTNASHTAVLEVDNGTFILNAGATLVVDTLIVTNSCGHFVKNGGTLIQNNLPVLDPNQSAANDGIPNGWKQQYGFDPFDSSVAIADPDHDGQDNLNEYLSGTNPTNAASVFEMISATPTNQNVRVDWTTVGGHSYVVQTNGNLGGGAFSDSSPLISVPGTNEGSTNYLHPGGGTNNTGFYRVRLGP